MLSLLRSWTARLPLRNDALRDLDSVIAAGAAAWQVPDLAPSDYSRVLLRSTNWSMPVVSWQRPWIPDLTGASPFG